MIYDYVVLGSGFGGGTVALRLAEAGKSVLILERGRRWHGKNLPAAALKPSSSPFPEPGQASYFWDRQLLNPFRQRLGLYDLRQFSKLQGLVAAGVGGGSLIWANVVVKAHEKAFQEGWPVGSNLDSLEPYYKLASKYLRASEVPGVSTVNHPFPGRPVPRAELHRKAAEKLKWKWRPAEIAVNFADDKIAAPNGFGNAKQMGCNYCGRCSAGCPQNAKNSVDLSYIAAAEARGAELRTLHEVKYIEADSLGYSLHCNRYELDGRLAQSLKIQCRHLLLAAGTFGSNELLLRSRAKGLLGALSPALGTRFSINGNVLSGALAVNSAKDDLNSGPAIASMIEIDKYVVEDIADPTFAAGMVGGSQLSRVYHFLKAYLGFESSAAQIAAMARDMLVYVGVGMDSSSGRLRLNALGGLSLDWPRLHEEAALKAQHRIQSSLARVLGRKYLANVFSTFGRQFTYHPLGGCPMGNDPKRAVVSPYGEVFGHRNLYIVDGSIIPSALGRNPAFTICALSERIAQRILEKRK
ncbi:MAG: GMC family oxidoreductase [Candidatus Obscuribacterales bacterium]|nr:GMC family oxidoreductase [Candidatus Obscuribacterales bacterium]